MEILKCFGYVAPGPHAFIMVIAVGRHTHEESETIKKLQTLFGESMMKHLILIFTRSEDLGNKTIDQYLDECPGLRQFKVSCKYLALNNKASQKERQIQVKKLLNFIELINVDTKNGYYTNKDFEEAEKAIFAREKEILENRPLSRSASTDSETRAENKRHFEQLKMSKVELDAKLQALQVRKEKCDKKYETKLESIKTELAEIRMREGVSAEGRAKERLTEGAELRYEEEKQVIWESIEQLQQQQLDIVTRMEDIPFEEDDDDDGFVHTDCEFFSGIREEIRCELDTNPDTILHKLRTHLVRLKNTLRRMFQSSPFHKR